MNGLLTPARFNAILTVPFNLAQTELRRSKTLHVATLPLFTGQWMDLASMTLNVLRVLTPGASPEYVNTALNSVSVGLYFGDSVASPVAVVKTATVGASVLNPYRRVRVGAPGVYTIKVSNNTSNLDFSVVVTGALRLHS